VHEEATVEVEQSDPGANARFTASRVDNDTIEPAHVDDEPAVHGRECLVAVSAGAGAKRTAFLARPTNGVLHIPRVATGDDGGRKAREAGIEV
jgi:hypothetical protein